MPLNLSANAFSWGGGVALPAVQLPGGAPGAFSWGLHGGGGDAGRSTQQDFHFRQVAQDFHRDAESPDLLADALMQGFAADAVTLADGGAAPGPHEGPAWDL